MTNISPAAEAAREAARSSTGEFGVQQHSAPARALRQEPAYPQVAVIGGNAVHLPRWQFATGSREDTPEWPSTLPKPNTPKWDYDDDGLAEVTISWGDGDRHVTVSRGAGDYADTYFTYGDSEGFDCDGADDEGGYDLTAEQREELEEYGETILRRARNIVGCVEYAAAMRDPGDVAAIARLIDPTPFTAEERQRVAADVNVNDACTNAGLPSMTGVLGTLRDRGELSDEDAAALTADDITSMYYEHIGPAIDRLADSLETSER